MKVSVELAGGSALLLESKPRSLSQLTADKAILMYCDPKSQPAWYKDCSTYLTRLITVDRIMRTDRNFASGLG